MLLCVVVLISVLARDCRAQRRSKLLSLARTLVRALVVGSIDARLPACLCPVSLRTVQYGSQSLVAVKRLLELLNAECTVTICHIATQDLAAHVKTADLLVSAIGKRDIIKSHWIKAGSIVVDAGINRSPEGITGDIECEKVMDQVSAITPVPHGVGPMTVAMLLENTWQSYNLRMHKAKDNAFTNITH